MHVFYKWNAGYPVSGASEFDPSPAFLRGNVLAQALREVSGLFPIFATATDSWLDRLVGVKDNEGCERNVYSPLGFDRPGRWFSSTPCRLPSVSPEAITGVASGGKRKKKGKSTLHQSCPPSSCSPSSRITFSQNVLQPCWLSKHFSIQSGGLFTFKFNQEVIQYFLLVPKDFKEQRPFKLEWIILWVVSKD